MAVGMIVFAGSAFKLRAGVMKSPQLIAPVMKPSPERES